MNLETTANQKIEFEKIFDTAWRFIKQYRFLYLFGFISAIGSTSTNGPRLSQLLQRYDSGIFALWEIPTIPDIPVVQWLPYFDDNKLMLYSSILIVVILWTTHFIADAGLIFATAELHNDKTPEIRNTVMRSFGKGFRLLFLNLLLFGGFYVILFLVVEEVITGKSRFFVETFTTSSIGCVLLPLALMSWGIYPFATRSMVYCDNGIFASIRHSFHLIIQNLVRLVPVFIFLFFAALTLSPVTEAFVFLLGKIFEYFDSLTQLLKWPFIFVLTLAGIFITTYFTIVVTLLFLDCNKFLADDHISVSS